MTTPPRRARFQIHLSTAIVLMFAAGGLIWANTMVRGSQFHLTQYMRIYYISDDLGWPAHAFTHYFKSFSMFEFERAPEHRKTGVTHVHDRFEFHPKGIALNLFVLFTILFAAWLTCEWLIRRRAARKGA
jgi:hypothetical protein